MWALILIWAANFSVVKAALIDFEPLAFNAARFVLASALMLVFLRHTGGLPRFKRSEWPVLVGLGLLGNTLYQVLFIFGIDGTLAGNSALILGTVPAYVAVLSSWLGHERLGTKTWVGVALSLVGVALVVWGSARVEFGQATVRGDLLMVAAAIGWSLYTVGSSPLVRRYGALPVTSVTLWIGTVGLVLISVPSLSSQSWTVISWASWAGLLYSGAFSIAVAYLLWYYGVRHMGSTRTALYSNAIPIVALAIAWLTLGETPGWLQLLGAVAIVIGVTLSREKGVKRGDKKGAVAGDHPFSENEGLEALDRRV